jgi:2-oxoglutarate dehydrogenase E2 component (dihydrolipoamide succinyltransferase)
MVVFWKYVVYPIINPPQSAILGMHNIIERQLLRKVEIHPMMYVFTTRIIDGKNLLVLVVSKRSRSPMGYY